MPKFVVPSALGRKFVTTIRNQYRETELVCRFNRREKIGLARVRRSLRSQNPITHRRDREKDDRDYRSTSSGVDYFAALFKALL
jgi:hypothetical protein